MGPLCGEGAVDALGAVDRAAAPCGAPLGRTSSLYHGSLWPGQHRLPIMALVEALAGDSWKRSRENRFDVVAHVAV
ncbi:MULTISPECIES: hypothetical protein [Sorangium]|uniref:Uncharacterized protein n=1 Tax=Sorangium cellulosum TaxID=56 RepID=A0A4P2QLA7_SORCE|nr:MULTISPECIES: hypothetical protein [Sorangium]AUX30725.1 uncharacterized protein SOCE836_028360 [Sorangium cellulosum]WCQ90111.1 hypothetical protein NQZ70_02812 [Sorangium sp. Soce836]